MTHEAPGGASKHAMSRFALSTFEALDIEGEDAQSASGLRSALEMEIHARMLAEEGDGPLDDVVRELNEVGHRFEPRGSDPGWRSFFQTTNDGTRDFHIHTERDGDEISVMVLYFEKIDVTRARALAEMAPKEREAAVRADRFYERGAELSTLAARGGDLSEDERVHLVLFSLETGVSNGGFGTYLENTEGAEVDAAREALERVGAREMLSVVEEVLALFPGGFASGLTDEHRAVLDARAEELDALDGRFYEARDDLPSLFEAHAS